VTRVPIRLRVAAAFAVAMAIVLAATGWFLYARLDSHLSAALDRELRVRAQDLASLVRDPRASLAPPGRPLVEQGESYAQLLDARGRVLDATPPLRRFPLLREDEVARAAADPLFENRGPIPGLDEPSRLLATPVSRGGAPAVLVVGATREDRTETLVHLRNELLVAGPIALALATLAGYLLAGISLRPVEAMRRRATAITAQTPGERLPVPATHDELERLGETLNEMLSRLEDALQREREFVADAGHELRTPLALLRTELELALRHGGSAEELREAIGRSAEEADRIAQLAEDLLLLARSEGGRLPLHVERLEVAEVLARVADRFAWRAEDAGRALDLRAPDGLAVPADRLRLEQALGNLVDNALRHGAGAVALSARQVDGSIELHVGDEGAGIAPEFLGRAFDRFTRADGARPAGGAGLGLSIARAIAEAHGGTAGATNRDGSGLDVWLKLPISPDCA
jgi:two-component system OmpR family sensor kinase